MSPSIILRPARRRIAHGRRVLVADDLGGPTWLVTRSFILIDASSDRRVLNRRCRTALRAAARRLAA